MDLKTKCYGVCFNATALLQYMGLVESRMKITNNTSLDIRSQVFLYKLNYFIVPAIP